MKIKVGKHILTDRSLFLFLSIVMGMVLVGQFYLKWTNRANINTETMLVSSILFGSCLYFSWHKNFIE